MTAPLLEVSGLVKDYQALRPLRIRAFTLVAGDIVAVGGLDAIAAQTFVNLVTGATLPDSGDIALFGQSTKVIADGDAWLKSLDGIGMVTSRGIVVEMFSVVQKRCRLLNTSRWFSNCILQRKSFYSPASVTGQPFCSVSPTP